MASDEAPAGTAAPAATETAGAGPRTAGRRVGPRRLAVLMSAASVALCALLMALVLAFYGAPHNPVWWGAMAAILAGAALVPPMLVPAVDWVIDGYRRDGA